MKTRRVDSTANYLSPGSPHWARIAVTAVDLMPAPLQSQPSAYVRNAWANKAYGQTGRIEVASVHDGAMWALRATWKASDAGVTEFPDAMAIALPVRNFPVLALMGSKDAPIHYLRWSAGEDGVRSVLSTGIGESRSGPELKRAAQARADGALRQIVVARALGGGGEVAPLLAGTKTAIGFAVWNGANEERAGLKAFSVDWIPLEMEA